MFLHILLFLPSARSIKMRMQNFSVFDWSVLVTWPKWPSIFEIWYCFPWFLLFTFSFLIRSVIRKFHQLNCRISIRWPKLTNQEARICVFAYTAIFATRLLNMRMQKIFASWLVIGAKSCNLIGGIFWLLIFFF